MLHNNDAKTERNKNLPIKRSKSVRRSIIISDKIARWIITAGGITVITAVFGIMFFLLRQALPLFYGAEITDQREFVLKTTSPSLALMSDDYNALGIHIDENLKITSFHLKTGTLLQSPEFGLSDQIFTSFASYQNGKGLALGMADGSVWLGELNFEITLVPVESVPLQSLKHLYGDDFTNGTSIFRKISDLEFRKISAILKHDETVKITDSPIVSIDIKTSGDSERKMNSLVILDEKGGFYLQKRRKQLNLFTGTMATDVESFQLPSVDNVHKVSKLVLHDSGRMVFVIKFHTSELFRYLTDDPENPYLIETVKLLPESVAVTSAEFLLGQGSLLIAGSDGSLRSFFLVARDTSANQDGLEFREAKAFDDQLEPIVLMGSSLRDKTFAAASKDGRLTLFHGTSEKTLLDIPSSNPISALNISPRLNGLVTVHQNGQARLIEFDAAHPQTNLKTLFGKIWYEGYQEPSYTWQSSAGTDDFEPKLSLIPLIFGTLKATFYTLIFAIPIGILAAIYTSEFISLRTRSVVKPMMEMMASLPSVVLGFVAALVLAPIVETWISAVLVVFLALPLGLLLAAYLWQLVPSEHTSKVNDSGKLMFKASVVLFTMWISYLMGVPLEQLMFEGDFKSWLMGQQGSSTPFLFLMMLPIHFIIIFALFSRFWGRQINQRMMTLSAPKAALLDFARFAGLSIVSFVLSWLSAVVLQSFGVDVRGGFVDTYVQRNTLVVGLAMGFAVIPIIYTLAEDALKAVPEHLRAGSLGCGATHWQTAIWIVLPTAISGVFSAIMIGMGRAVGETMIVVMATGNTPIMETNIFNGLRALSATIAVELPEAVKEGTLYRVLFLAGLVLFSMTFFINTLAEIVRMRFRKRAKQL